MSPDVNRAHDLPYLEGKRTLRRSQSKTRPGRMYIQEVDRGGTPMTLGWIEGGLFRADRPEFNANQMEFIAGAMR